MVDFLTDPIFLLSLNVCIAVATGSVSYYFYKKAQKLTRKNPDHESIINAKKFQDIIMQNIPDYVFVKDEKFRIVQANPAFMSLYPENMQDKIIGYTTLEKYGEEEAEAFLAMDKKAMREGVSETEETIRFPDGQIRTLFTKKVRFKNDQEDTFILGVARDITDIKEAQKKLIEVKHTNKAYADATNDGYWDWFLKDNYEYMSPRFWKMFGYDPKEKNMTPRNGRKLFSPKTYKLPLIILLNTLKREGCIPLIRRLDIITKMGQQSMSFVKEMLSSGTKTALPFE